MQSKNQSRITRHIKIRHKISGTASYPRLAVFRSLTHIYAQLINDETSKTLFSVSDFDIKETNIKPVEKATLIGKMIAKKAIENKINKAVFDRGGYQYHGRVKAIAEGAREGGLQI